MCLIITGASNKIRETLLYTNSLLDDIYESNSDGVGIMYANKRGLKVVKKICRSIHELYNFISNMPDDDRNMAIHFRMKTHGDIDLFNCHPYSVVEEEVAMMHNGILDTGNKKDPSKSDTWHFIQDYLVDTVIEAPAVVHANGFREMVGEFIGNNRFVFMDKHGTMSHVNFHQGIEHDGMWFSNTYAWSPALLIPNFRFTSAYSGTYGGWMFERDEDWEDRLDRRWYTTKQEDKEDFEAWEKDSDIDAESLLEMVTEWCDVDALVDLLDRRPYKVLTTLFEHRIPLKSHFVRTENINAEYARIIDEICAERVSVLLSLAIKDSSSLAECLCYYIDWAIPTRESANPVQQHLELAVDNERYAA